MILFLFNWKENEILFFNSIFLKHFILKQIKDNFLIYHFLYFFAFKYKRK